MTSRREESFKHVICVALHLGDDSHLENLAAVASVIRVLLMMEDDIQGLQYKDSSENEACASGHGVLVIGVASE